MNALSVFLTQGTYENNRVIVRGVKLGCKGEVKDVRFPATRLSGNLNGTSSKQPSSVVGSTKATASLFSLRGEAL